MLEQASYDYQQKKGKIEIINSNGNIDKTIVIDKDSFETDFLELKNKKL